MRTAVLQAALEIDGFMTAAELAWLAEQARTHTRILEIGSFRGRSTVAMLEATSGTVTSVDPFDSPVQSWHEYLAPRDWAGVRADFLANTAPYAAKLFHVERASDLPPGDFDFIFIDGEHDTASVLFDLDTYWPRLAPCGLFSGHDWGHPGVTPAVLARFPKASITRPVGLIWTIQESPR